MGVLRCAHLIFLGGAQVAKEEDERNFYRRTRKSIRVRWDNRAFITPKGWLFAEGQQRVCATCGVDQLPSGYVYGDELYCEEHEPEHFGRDFRMLAQKQKDDGTTFQEWDCYWTKWEMADDV